MNGLLVQYSPWKQYIEAETSYEGPVFALPRVFFEETNHERSEDIKLVVPGNVFERRDYDLVLDAFKELSSTTSRPVELHLLGYPTPERGDGEYGPQILERCSQLATSGFDVRYHREWVPHETFRSVLARSDLVISPLGIKETEYAGYTERLGETHGTGVVFDALGHGKPILLPSWYELGAEIEPSAMTYENHEEFRAILTRFVDDHAHREERQQAALRNSRRFPLQEQQARFSDIIDEVLRQ